MFNVSKRGVVKFVKDQIIWTAAAQATETAINTVFEEPTENQETGIEVTSLVVGYVAMRSLKERTDRMIDTVADFSFSRKNKDEAITE